MGFQLKTAHQLVLKMRKLARQFRNPEDDKISLPTVDDARPMDINGLSFSFTFFPRYQICLIDSKSKKGSFLFIYFVVFVLKLTEQEELVRSLEKMQAHQSLQWKVVSLLFHNLKINK